MLWDWWSAFRTFGGAVKDAVRWSPRRVVQMFLAAVEEWNWGRARGEEIRLNKQRSDQGQRIFMTKLNSWYVLVQVLCPCGSDWWRDRGQQQLHQNVTKDPWIGQYICHQCPAAAWLKCSRTPVGCHELKWHLASQLWLSMVACSGCTWYNYVCVI